jgi:hypothetical protein
LKPLAWLDPTKKKIQDSKFDDVIDYIGIYRASLFARVKAAAGQKTKIACSCLNGRRRRPISRRRRPRLSTLNGQVFVEVHTSSGALFAFFQVPTQCQEMASAADAELQIS